ncbi:DNA/RNA helicase domain-containing protein [Streptomyces hygroscopicus]|uniref:DNA/RNA helicase domain-containing protein n=1 Tax=Streptomyces hygroscopicus TaxID=1912 RepID=UPI000783D1F5|nr:DNA/RNA helicase domain-containing protein [Streptomyces hygroscopicus]
MHIFGGTVAQAAARIADPAFITECAHRFRTIHGRSPGEAEVRSWENSWPPLLRVLSAAELSELHLLLEYELPGTSQRVDALLLGHRPRTESLVAVAVELKQWQYAAPHGTGPGMLNVGKREVLHPARQVGGYVNYLTEWVPPELHLDVEGLAYLHAAPSDLIDGLRGLQGTGPSAAYSILGPDDVAPDAPSHLLAERLHCGGLRPAAPQRVTAFLEARHRPSPKLLARVADVIGGHETFRLIGEQDKARQRINSAIDAARQGHRGHIVVVTGGPGTGKTAIATRVLGDLCRDSGANPRLLSPTGTLSRQLGRAVGESARGLIATLTTRLPEELDKDTSVVLLDEAHRARTGQGWRTTPFPKLLTDLMTRCAVLVLFLDEGQIVRPGEGTTKDELRRMASQQGCTFAHVDLPTQFRCSGSRPYLDWVDALLSPEARPPRWNGDGYDLALADNPAQLEEWVADHIRHGRSARITAGYCWPWDSPDVPPLLPDVSITWQDASGEHLWERPWNSRADMVVAGDGVPGRAFWATDEGGQQQVGCVYTAQGMEYDYSAVILGRDLTWTAQGWRAQPGESHDPATNRLSPQQYLRYALNIYRVLATRGTRGTRLYSTDPATQAFLRTVLPGRPHNESN